MGCRSIFRILFSLVLTVARMEAARLTGTQENAERVNHEINENIDPRELVSPKGNGQYIDKVLDILTNCFHCGSAQEHTKNVNDMITGKISPARLQTTKSRMMKNNGKYFHAMLGVGDTKNALPQELGIIATSIAPLPLCI
jgi:hypothetical protein